MGHIYRRKLKNGEPCAVWWIQYYANGRRVQESTGTTKETEAKKILKLKEGRVTEGQPILPRVDRVRFEEAAKDLVAFYETTGKRNLAEVGWRLKRLERFFLGRKLASISPADTTAYAAQRQGEDASAGTINRELAVLKRLLRLAYENGKLLRLPVIHLLKENAPRSGFFERDAFEAVRVQLPVDLQLAVTIAHTYGWRIRSEVLALQLRQVDLEKGTLRLDHGQTKNDEGRLVYLTPELKSLLREQIDRVMALMREQGAMIPYLFPHLKGRYQCQPRRDFVKAWKTACQNAGVHGMLRHDLRRTAVRNLEQRGVSRSVAMKITGHKTESVYRRYAIVCDADLQEATQKLVTTFSTTPANSPLAPNPATALEFTPRPGSSTGRVPAF